jgi:hypothetical protein
MLQMKKRVAHQPLEHLASAILSFPQLNKNESYMDTCSNLQLADMLRNTLYGYKSAACTAITTSRHAGFCWEYSCTVRQSKIRDA